MKESRHVKKEKNGGRILLILLSLILIVTLGFSIYNVLSILSVTRRADRAYSELRETVRQQPAPAAGVAAEPSFIAEPVTGEGGPAENEELNIPPAVQETSPELKGWIFSEGTEIDYPVVHGQDNDYYLDHLYDGTQNPAGAIFADYRNTGLLTDANTVLYGHNMNSGAMFSSLNEYMSQAWYESHPTMTLTTSQGDFRVELICGTVESGDEEFIRFSFVDFADMSAYLEEIRGRSTFESPVQLQPGDRLVTLCTCTYETANGRYMLVGKVSGAQ